MPRYSASPKTIAARDSILGWQDRAFLPIRPTATVLGVSTAAVYGLVHGGRLDAVKLAGRTLVKVDSLRALLAAAEPFVSSGPRGTARARLIESQGKAA